MKKILLFSLGLLVSSGMIAQTKNPKAMNFAAKKQTIDVNVSSNSVAPKQVLKSKGTNEATVTEIAASGNAYGTYTGYPGPLFYDPYTNIFTFVHRGGGTVPATNGGHIYYNYSTDNGATFTPNVDITPYLAASGYPAARYPSSIVASVNNSTDINNAAVASVGACLLKSTDTWGGIYNSSFKYDGTTVVGDSLISSLKDNVISGRPARNADGTNTWLVVANNADTTVNVYKGVVSGNNITWTLNTTLGGRAYKKDSTSATGLVAFSPVNPNLGYVVVFGHFMDFETKFQRPASMAKIFKTEDAGANWVELPDYDYGAALEDTLYRENLSAKAWPWMYYTTFDAVVDNANRLHLFGAPKHGVPSKCGYAYNGLTVTHEDNNKTYSTQYMDYVTTNGTDMKMIFVDKIKASIEPDFGAITHDIQPDVSMDKDGKYIIFSWIKNVEDTMEIIEPNVYARGMHYSQFLNTEPRLSPIVNLTAGTEAEGTAYHKHATTYLQVENDTTYNVPFSYAFLGNDDVTAMTHYFHAGTGINQSEMPIFDGGGFVENLNNSLNPVIYPNPTNGMLYISNAKDANVSVFNMLGAEVAKVNNNETVKTINMADYPAGTYYVKVSNANGVSTQKVVNVK